MTANTATCPSCPAPQPSERIETKMSKTVLRNFFAAATVAGLSLVLVQVSPAASAAAASAPTAPSNLTVTPADFNNIRLNWKDNSNNESGFEINNGIVSKGAPANSTAFTWGDGQRQVRAWQLVSVALAGVD
jgi:hypothetical protein